jgi:hypothetical protein
MPPLCTVGFGVGSGWNWQIISGAGLLFLTNLVAIATSAFIVFYLVGMDAPEVRAKITEEAMKEAAGKRFYQFLHNERVQKLFGDAGQMRWRVVMVLLVLGVLFIPLRSSLMQLKDETIARAAAREITRALVPSEHLLSQQLEIFPDHITHRVVTTFSVDKELLREKEVELAQRTGKLASIQIRQVANEEELIEIRDALRRPVAPPPAPISRLKEVAARARPLIEQPLGQVWPEQSALLLDYEVGFAKEKTVVRLEYEAPKALEPSAQEVLKKALAQSFDGETLEVEFQWKRGPGKR